MEVIGSKQLEKLDDLIDMGKELLLNANVTVTGSFVDKLKFKEWCVKSRIYLDKTVKKNSAYYVGFTEQIHTKSRNVSSVVKGGLTYLEELKKELAENPNDLDQLSNEQNTPTDKKKVFIVHGHDNEVKQTVARFLERLKLEPVILHEQANKSQTIIEKFEEHSDVAFAIVLFTPDDIGASQLAFEKDEKNSLKSRARQNVIYELGYFVGKLKRENVCVLKRDSVEKPSDMDGVLYVSFDAGGAWELNIAREMKAAGLEVDMNDL